MRKRRIRKDRPCRDLLTFAGAWNILAIKSHRNQQAHQPQALQGGLVFRPYQVVWSAEAVGPHMTATGHSHMPDDGTAHLTQRRPVASRTRNDSLPYRYASADASFDRSQEGECLP
ncbi:predicted protein [Streptomyces filamentosus NRRL 15998]|uniref:Predicted protein n=1 Tax=Streptomyces filamentosus NRRL 15998 TaxID=457431 RepID=D6AH57_STRFL|nr:predicted protein [Streptomyces filamentosus NRRL 15998]